MKKNKSIAKNYIYNLIYQMLTIFLPLVTTPYLSRVLGAKAIGIYGYTTSIVTYFILFGTLGISMYGQREIAYLSNNKEERSNAFWEIIVIRTFTLLISGTLFMLIYGFGNQYSLYYKILLIQLLSYLFDISWLFQGIEEFDKTVIRNLIVKLLCLILIFVFVKTKTDLWKYFLIYAVAEFIGNLSIWIYVPKYVNKINFRTLKIKKHLKPTLSLFLPQIAIQIYTVLDKTMLGLITSDMKEVGFYEQAQKIVRAALVITNSLQTVMNSRIASSFSSGNKKEINRCLNNSFQFAWLLSIPLCLGLIGVCKKFVPWYYGTGFTRVGSILIATAPILIAISLNGITGIQYLIQVGKQKIFTISVIFGAIINVIFNFLLIKSYGGIGASISSVIAETSIFIVQFIYLLKNGFDIENAFKPFFKCFISGMVMFGVISLITSNLSVSIINTLFEVVMGGLVYYIMLKILKFKFLNELENQIFSMFRRKRNE